MDFYEVLKEYESIVDLPRDEKRPFDNLYKALELLKPLAETKKDEYALACACICERLCFDTLEGNKLRYYAEIVDEMQDKRSLMKLCQDSPQLSSLFIQERATRALYLAQSQKFEEASDFLLDVEDAFNYVLGLERDVEPLFFTKEPIHACNCHTVAKNDLISSAIHCFFYEAQILQNLDKYEESARYCGKCLQLQLQYDLYVKSDWVKQAVDLQRYYAIHCKWQQCFDLLSKASCIISGVAISEDADQLLRNIHSFPQNEAIDEEILADYKQAVAQSVIELLAHLKHANTKIGEDGCSELRQLVSLADSNGEPGQMTRQLLDSLAATAEDLLNQSKRYFVLDGFVTAHSNIVLNLSQLCSLKIEFLHENQLQLNNARIDMVRPLVQKISSHHYPKLYEELLQELDEARMQQFDHVFKNEQNQQVVASYAAKAIEQCQSFVKYIENIAFARAKVELKKEKIEFDEWVGYVATDSVDHYIDACFNISVVFSKFPYQKKQMMENALDGFLYCEKLWGCFQSRADNDFDENLELVRQMKVLMELRISQME